MSKNIGDVRAALFSALEGLADKSLDIERAKAICEVSQTIINSAKVEVDFLRATGASGPSTGFLQLEQQEPDLPAGIVGIRQHRIRG